MGGSGSGRWRSHDAKQTVEDGLILPISQIAEALNEVADGSRPAYVGGLSWSRAGRVISSIGFRVLPDSNISYLYLFYTITRWGGEKVEADYRVEVVTTTPNFGGRRWWWICPLVKNGYACRRRVAKLYQPPGATYFGCRQCYDLTYTSCKESHQLDSLWEYVASRVNKKRGLANGQGFSPADVGRLLKLGTRWNNERRK